VTAVQPIIYKETIVYYCFSNTATAIRSWYIT
jgi:hypothetical protein